MAPPGEHLDSRALPAARKAAPLALLLALAILVGCGDDDETTTTGTDGGEPVRTALAESDRPEGAPGRALGLSRVTIPPDGEIPLHHHEGTQVAYIDEGTLTYTVEEGSVEVMEGAPGEDAKPKRSIEAGETGSVDSGQWIVEQPETVHRAANEGEEAIVIYLSTLLRKGAPPATPNR